MPRDRPIRHPVRKGDDEGVMTTLLEERTQFEQSNAQPKAEVFGEAQADVHAKMLVQPQVDAQSQPVLNRGLYRKMLDTIQECHRLVNEFGGHLPSEWLELWHCFATFVANLSQPDRDSFDSFVHCISLWQGLSHEEIRRRMEFFWRQASVHLPPGPSRYVQDGTPLLANAIEEYLKSHRAQQHVRDKRSRLYEFLRWCDSRAEPIRTVKVTPAEMNEYFAWLRQEKPVTSGARRGQRGLSRQGCENHRNVLHHFFNWCVRRGWCSENPVDSVNKFAQHPLRRLVKVTPVEQTDLAKLVRSLDESDFRGLRDKLLILYLYDFGRISEVERIRIADLDLIRGDARVETKHKRERILRFSRLTVDLLKKYLREREKLIRSKQEALRRQGRYSDAQRLNHGYLFVSERTGLPLTKNGAYRSIKNVAVKAGMPHLTAAVLRKGAVADHICNGGTHDQLQVLMAHTDIRTTQRYTLGVRVDYPDTLPGDRLARIVELAS